MGKHRGKKVSRAAIMGTAVAAVVGVGLTPTVANAVSSNTYFIGFPEWTQIGGTNALDSVR